MQRACFWCGQEDTAWHRYWACRRLSQHLSEYVQETNGYTEHFQDVSREAWAQCLWARAILPCTLGRWKRRNSWEEDITPQRTYNYDQLASVTKDIATDGSGGLGGVPVQARRVGCAVAIMKEMVDAEGRVQIEDVEEESVSKKHEKRIQKKTCPKESGSNKTGRRKSKGSVCRRAALLTIHMSEPP